MLWFALSARPAAPATFVVTTTADSRPGSLREAILDANAAAGTDTIAFAIPEAGIPQIKPLTALPALTSPVLIDGTTQAPVGLVALDGSAGTGARGLDVTAGDSTLRGLVVHGFSTTGIHLALGGGNVVEGCVVGTDAGATAALATTAVGIDVSSGSNRIGGTTPEAANVVAGNNGGISIHGATATANVVAGNFIGTGPAPATGIGNTSYGIFISSRSAARRGTSSPGTRRAA
jgi:hypothetical protein